MPIEELVKMLPAKQADALQKKYDTLDPEQRDSFLEKASNLVDKYTEATNKSGYTKSTGKQVPASNADPMELKAYEDWKKKSNRDPMVLQAELDASKKKSYVMKPSVFKKTGPKTKTIVEGYMSLDPNQYMTPTPKQNKAPMSPQTGSSLLKGFKEEQAGRQRAAGSNYDEMIKKGYSWDFTTKTWKKNPGIFKQFINQI